MTDPKGELERKRREFEVAQVALAKLRERIAGIPPSQRSSVIDSDLEAQEKLVKETQLEISRLERQVSEEEARSSARDRVFSQLRFTNRRDELKRLSDPTAVPTYLVIDAPGDYGKTFLLNALIELYH
jgi:chromosome segregation ATPase